LTIMSVAMHVHTSADAGQIVDDNSLCQSGKSLLFSSASARISGCSTFDK